MTAATRSGSPMRIIIPIRTPVKPRITGVQRLREHPGLRIAQPERLPLAEALQPMVSTMPFRS